MMKARILTPLDSEHIKQLLESSSFCFGDESLFEALLLEDEHYHLCNLNSYTYIVTILPVTGLILPNDGMHTPLPVYHYCPDQRKNTFKLLGKVSPGLPPPSFN